MYPVSVDHVLLLLLLLGRLRDLGLIKILDIILGQEGRQELASPRKILALQPRTAHFALEIFG
jgi:hypothetical protein